MKKFLLVLAVLLSGCQREQTPTHIAAQNAVNVIAALYESLPAECKNDTNAKLTMVAQNQVMEVETHCKAQIKEIEREKIKWKLGFLALSIVILVYAVRKVLK